MASKKSEASEPFGSWYKNSQQSSSETIINEKNNSEQHKSLPLLNEFSESEVGMTSIVRTLAASTLETGTNEESNLKVNETPTAKTAESENVAEQDTLVPFNYYEQLLSTIKRDNVKFISFNCKGMTQSVECLKRLCEKADLIALQETWLKPTDLYKLEYIDDDFNHIKKSGMDKDENRKGRNFGGVAILWRKRSFILASEIPCNNVRICAIEMKISDKHESFLVFSVYMPQNVRKYDSKFTKCLEQISEIIQKKNVRTAFILGDFNAPHREERFEKLRIFCSKQKWRCVDFEILKPESDMYTYFGSKRQIFEDGSIKHKITTTSWLDHCIVTETAWQAVQNVEICLDTYRSDHLPLQIICRFNEKNSKTLSDICYDSLINVSNKMNDFFTPDKRRSIRNHRMYVNILYHNIVFVVIIASITTTFNKLPPIKWTKDIKDAHICAWSTYKKWSIEGSPKAGKLYSEMKKGREALSSRLELCLNKQNYNMKEMNYDRSEDGHIAPCVFGYAVRENNLPSTSKPKTYIPPNTEQVRSIIEKMKSESPDLDGLTIEHLQNAGEFVPKFFCFIADYCYKHNIEINKNDTSFSNSIILKVLRELEKLIRKQNE